MKSNPVQYDNLSKVFHWVTAIVVVIAFVLGPGDFGRLVNGGVDPATRLDIVWHESLGVAVFVLTLARLLWLAGRRGAPRHPMPAWMAGVSRFVHWVLWGLLISLPLSAAMALGSESHPLTLLGGLRFSGFSAISGADLSHVVDWGEVHKFLGDVMMWLAGLHAAAALYHHFKLRDRVLVSMLP
ncbi:MAG: cytochrome b/b6 domain-containing protein [Ramlibacter sp.]|nr:cytochrome b/b6 domain-containing protein [Ramlibacter sp.]